MAKGLAEKKDEKETKVLPKTKKMELTRVADNSKAVVTIWHYLGVGLWLGWFGFYAYLPFVLVALYYLCKPALAGLIGVLVVLYILPIDRDIQPKWGYALGANLMKKAAEYFHLEVYCEDFKAVNESGPAIWSIEPHDVLPLGLFAMSDYLGTFPGHKMMGCLTSACFVIPGMKHVYTWASACSVDKKNLQKLLAEGVSPTVCPGGAMEVTFLNHKRELTMYIKKRMGLVRLAMQFGVPIIPTVAYNQRDAFSFYVPKNKFLHKLGRKSGFIPMLICGVWNIPFAQPKPRALQVVVGRPIPIPKVEGKPSDELLKKYHDIFVEATEQLYQDHKEQFGMGDITLKVL